MFLFLKTYYSPFYTYKNKQTKQKKMARKTQKIDFVRPYET